MSLTALTKELNTLKDKEEWLEVSALRLAAMKVFVKHQQTKKQIRFGNTLFRSRGPK